MAAQESVATEIHRAAMLTKCRACERECSVNAASCPGCGEPFRKAEELKQPTLAEAVALARPVHSPQAPQIVTTQNTGKGWKLMLMLGIVLSISGGAIATFSFQRIDPDDRSFVDAFRVGVLVLSGGLILFIFARIGAWWNHG